MSHFSFKVQNLPIFKVLNFRKENFNRLALLHLSCTIPGPKFERMKISFQYFLVEWKYLRTRGPADLLVDTGQGLNASKAQVRGHVTIRQPK